MSQEVTAFQRRLEAWTAITVGSRGDQHTASGHAVAGERGRGKEGETTLPPAVLALEVYHGCMFLLWRIVT